MIPVFKRTVPETSEQRIARFCDWLEHFPPGAPFHKDPQFARLFGDMTKAEMDRAGDEMLRRDQERAALPRATR